MSLRYVHVCGRGRQRARGEARGGGARWRRAKAYLAQREDGSKVGVEQDGLDDGLVARALEDVRRRRHRRRRRVGGEGENAAERDGWRSRLMMRRRSRAEHARLNVECRGLVSCRGLGRNGSSWSSGSRRGLPRPWAIVCSSPGAVRGDGARGVGGERGRYCTCEQEKWGVRVAVWGGGRGILCTGMYVCLCAVRCRGWHPRASLGLCYSGVKEGPAAPRTTASKLGTGRDSAGRGRGAGESHADSRHREGSTAGRAASSRDQAPAPDISQRRRQWWIRAAHGCRGCAAGRHGWCSVSRCQLAGRHCGRPPGALRTRTRRQTRDAGAGTGGPRHSPRHRPARVSK